MNALKREVLAHLTRLGIELPAKEDLPEFVRTAIPRLVGIEWDEAQLEAIVAKLAEITDNDAAQRAAWGTAEVPAEEDLATST